jgi:hypothetical protein
MLMPATLLALATLIQQQPAADTGTNALAVINARLGSCSADFTVTDPDGRPVYAALIHVRIRYGFMSFKRMDLEVGTDSGGRARVEGLPAKAMPLTYDISKGDKKATAAQDLSATCPARFEIGLK